MERIKKQLSHVFLGALIFTFLFWKQSAGINTFIFSLATIVYFYYNKLLDFNNKKILLSTSGLILSSLFIVINNSSACVFAYNMAFAVFLGVVFIPEIKTTYYAVIAMFHKALTAQKQLLETFKQSAKTKESTKFFYHAKIWIIPLVVLFVFHLIFINANPKYQTIINKVSEKLDFLSLDFITDNFFSFLFFYIFSFLIITFFVFPGDKESFNNLEAGMSDKLERKRSSTGNFKTMALKTENKIGTLIVIMINILLLIVNAIDISWIWFGNVSTDAVTLSQLVHKGTYLLILSIFLSMAIILYFFRGNQNFYSENKILKKGAYFWLIQNVVLAISVLLRNMHYINNAGLAYKRIGIFFFLSLIITGLILMFIKIKEKKSMFYLIRTNSWSVYIMFVLLGAVNWDVFIAKYNIAHNEKGIDRYFLYRMSDKALYIIDANKTKILKSKYTDNKKIKNYDLDNKKGWNKKMNNRIYRFIQEYEQKSWKSWNYAEYKSYKILKAKYPKIKYKN